MLVAGASQEGIHLIGINFPRDFAATAVGDIARAFPGQACAVCGSALRMRRGVEVASSKAFESALHFTGPEGHETRGSIVWFGLFPEIALVAAAAATDGEGLGWPRSIAPFDVHVILLVDRLEARALADSCVEGGLDVLFDDREVPAGG